MLCWAVLTTAPLAMANFGVILLECETLIKEAQTSRDKQAVLDKAVTDAQVLISACADRAKRVDVAP